MGTRGCLGWRPIREYSYRLHIFIVSTVTRLNKIIIYFLILIYRKSNFFFSAAGMTHGALLASLVVTVHLVNPDTFPLHW